MNQPLPGPCAAEMNRVASAAPQVAVPRRERDSGLRFGQTARHAFEPMRLVVACVAKFESLGRRAPVRFSFLAVGILMALMFVFFIPSFQSNDDPQLMMIAAGRGACRAPDEHLVFTSVIIGHALKAFYDICPSVPWYGVYLYLAHYLAQGAILFCTIARGYTRLRLGLFVVFFVVAEVFLFNNLQFTMTAALVGQAGVLVCLVALQRLTMDASSRVRGLLASGVALLLLGSLIRLECFYLTSIVALPAAIAQLGWRPRRRVLLSTACAAGVCLAMVLGCAAYNDAYYARDPQWRGFFDYNQVRIKFNDYAWINYSPETAHLFDQVEWSENDHTMILNWFYDDAVLYSKSRLERLAGSHPWRDQRLTAAYWQTWLSTLWYDKSIWALGLVVPLFLGCSAAGKRGLWGFLASTGMALTLLCGLAVFNKAPPSRVYFPVLMFPLGLLLMAVREHALIPRQRWPGLALRTLLSPACWRRSVTRALLRPTMAHVALALTAIALTYSVKPQLRRSRKVEANRQEMLEYVRSLEPRGDQLYVVWAPGFPYETISPFDNLDAFAELHQLVLGWPQHTPHFDSMKEKFGVESVSSALFERPDVFLLGHDHFHSLYRTFVREHYGVDVEFVTRKAREQKRCVVGQFEPRTDVDVPTSAQRPSQFEQR